MIPTVNTTVTEMKTLNINASTDIDVTLWEDGDFWLTVNSRESSRAVITVDDALELAECLLNFAELRNNQLKKQNNETN